MSNYEVVIERADEYSEELAAAIGRLMPFLSEGHSDEPISEENLQEIIESPDREQLIAVLEGKVVGSAVLNTIVGDLHRKGWLEDFVVDETLQGRGIGGKIWLEMLNWCKERNLDVLDFTSGEDRKKAHRFYIQHGAKERDSVAYRVEINQD